MSIGGLIALLVLVVCVIVAFVGGVDPKVAGLIGALAVSVLLLGFPLRVAP